MTEEKKKKMLQAKTTKEFYEAAAPLENRMSIAEFGEECANHLLQLYAGEKDDKYYAEDPTDIYLAFSKGQNKGKSGDE